MTIIGFTFLVLLGAVAAGFLGALTGLGGGFVIVPLLTLGFGVDIRYAIGASLVSVIATSSGSAAAYVREGFTNIRVAMLLETATTAGAICGALVAQFIKPSSIAVVFGAVLVYSAWLARRPHRGDLGADQPDALAQRLRLDGEYPSGGSTVPYHVHNVPAGYGVMMVAGVLSGLLGIGSGAVKVLAMDQAMRLPFKVSTTTSNFMIGVTAAASAGVYLGRGYIAPGLAMPVMLGVLAGSVTGARVLTAARTDRLRLAFSVVMVLLGLEMIFNGLTGRI